MSSDSITQILGKTPELNHLTQILAPVEYQFITIGIELNVPHGEIESIRYSRKPNSTKLSDILQLWLNKKRTRITWDYIIGVIGGPVIDNQALVDDIKTFLAKDDILMYYASKPDSK